MCYTNKLSYISYNDFKRIYIPLLDNDKLNGNKYVSESPIVDMNRVKLYCNNRYRILGEDAIIKCFKKCDIYNNELFDIYTFKSALQLCGFALTGI